MNLTHQVLEGFLLRNLSLFSHRKLNLVAAPAGLPTYTLVNECQAANLSLTSADWRSFSLARGLDLATSFAFPAEGLTFNPAQWQENFHQILFWPKAKEEGYFWLQALQQAGFSNVYLVGENKAGVQAAAKNLTQLGAEVVKLDAAKRCSLFKITTQGINLSSAAGQEITWQLTEVADKELASQPLTLVSQPGVFSHGRLDEGTQLLLSCLADLTPPKQTALDLGCGYGVLAAALAKKYPHLQLTLSDVNAFALSASAKTLAANHQQAKLLGADVFSGLQAAKPTQGWDLIITNPPFHQGKATSYAATTALINQAKNFLSPKGQLCLVANSFLPYEDLIKQAFNRYQLIKATNKFKVYLADNV